MTIHFELQPSETELQRLAEQYWQQACNRERQLETEAFEAGASIRNGEYSLANLEAIVRWKSERLVHYLIGNGSERIHIELDFEDLEALGQVRQDVRFYEEYLSFCRTIADKGIVQPQEQLPGPTPLHALDRALAQWARNRVH